MKEIKIQCPNKDCEKEINFTFESPEECPRCGKVLFKAIDELANEVAKEMRKAQTKIKNIFDFKIKIITDEEHFPGYAMVIKDKEGIAVMEGLIKEYNQEHEKRKRIEYKKDLLLRNSLIVFPKIAIQDARLEIRKLEMYRFFKFIINKKHT